MRIEETIDLILHGAEAKSAETQAFFDEILAGVRAVVWPRSGPDFAIFPEKRANGVKPIKNACMRYLAERGWQCEPRLTVGADSNPGAIDAARRLSSGKWFVLEWETGNISSSHRAINKMLLGMKRGLFGAAVLIVPTRALYKYLTDRVGNLDELMPYLEIWRSDSIDGRLSIVAIEHDREDRSVRKIPKGTDGWSKKRRARRRKKGVRSTATQRKR